MCIWEMTEKYYSKSVSRVYHITTQFYDFDNFSDKAPTILFKIALSLFTIYGILVRIALHAFIIFYM